MNKNLIAKQNTELVLNKSKLILNITSKILSGKTNLTTQTIEHWIIRLWKWADENVIDSNIIPRNKDLLLALNSIDLKGPLLKNKLTELPKEIGNLTNLKTLVLWKVELIKLPKEIGNLTNLTVLNLGGNSLTELPKEMGNLSSLIELHLWNNQLTELPREIGNLTNLTILNLENNPLVELPKEIGNLTNLTEFHIRYISGLNLTGDQRIWISNLIINNCAVGILGTRYDINFFRILSDDAWMQRLWEWADENGIPNLPRDEKRLLTFQTLSIEFCLNNTLGYLPNEIGNLTQLNDLYLHDIVELPDTITNLKNLKNLTILWYYCEENGNNSELISKWIDELEIKGCNVFIDCDYH